jgi:pimeloyl-ACP methyl ester carboxylesterase
LTDLTRRGALAGFAGSVAAFAVAPAVRATPAPRTRERLLPAQTSWTPPPTVRPAREGVAEVAGTRLYWQDSGGRGEVVVLLHAWTGSYAFWAYQVGPLAAAGYRVITYSQRGHARSGPIDPAAPGTVTGDLKALLDHLGIARAHLVGTAGGALPALDFGLTWPERTASLVLSSSIMGISDPEVLAVGRTMFPRGVYAVSHTFSEIGPSYRAGYPEGVAAWEALEHDAWQGGEVRQQVATPITFARMNASSVPILLITGDADLMMPPSRLRHVARNVPRCELVFVAEAGHSLHWEQPEAFNAATLDYLARHRGGPRRTRR